MQYNVCWQKQIFICKFWPVLKIYLCQKIFYPKTPKLVLKIPYFGEKITAKLKLWAPVFYSVRNFSADWRKIATSCLINIFGPRKADA